MTESTATSFHKYSARGNLGTASKPFYVYKDIGVLTDWSTARDQLEEMLSSVMHDIKWEIIEDDSPVGVVVSSTPHSEDTNGFTLTAYVTGVDSDELADSLEQMANSVREGNNSGFDSNDTGEYSFERYGEECKPNVLDFEFQYAIFKNDNLILQTDDEDEANEAFDAIEVDETENCYYLLAEKVDFDHGEENAQYIALTDMFFFKYDCESLHDFTEELKREQEPKHAFELLQKKGSKELM